MTSPIPLRNKAPDPAARPMSEAMSHHQAGRLDEAEKLYRIAIGLAPMHAEALRLLGTLYLQTKKPDQAIPLLRDALKVQPKHPEILNNLGIALRDTAQPDEAIQCFQEALRLHPHYPEALNNLGSVYQNQEKFSEAASLYEQALRLRPDYITATGNLATALRMLGQYERSVECYRQVLKQVPAETKYWIGLGLAHRKLRQADDAVACFQRALQLTPNDFAIYNFLAGALQDQGKWDSAIDFYNRVLQIDPINPEVYVNLGSCWWSKNNLPIAVHCYQLALSQKPDMVDAQINLGAALWGVGRREEGRAKIEDVLRREPNNIAALINYGIMFHDEGHPGDALPVFDRVLGQEPNNRMAQWRKSLVLLALGQYREGWELYETGLGHRAMRGPHLVNEKPWGGAPMPNKRLLITCEQGFGDSLQFIRYAEKAKQCFDQVIVLCPKHLVRLFKGLPYVANAVETVEQGAFDTHVSMLSLPHRFGTTVETIPAQTPYLFVAPDVQNKWDEKFTGIGGLKVGLAWAGSAREEQTNSGQVDQRRSISLELMKPFFDTPNVRFYNLQKDKAAEQIKKAGLENALIDFMPEANDFADTAALINNLDLVITVDTSVAHLAGGLGKPVWILSRYDACWRWLKNQPTSPWYPTARIFGQPKPADWDSVLKDVVRALQSFSIQS